MVGRGLVGETRGGKENEGKNARKGEKVIGEVKESLSVSSTRKGLRGKDGEEKGVKRKWERGGKKERK